MFKKKKSAAVDKNSSFIFCTQLGTQNAENGISELPDLKIRWGSMPQNPPRLRSLMAPCSYSWLFSSTQLHTSNFIETPALCQYCKVWVFLIYFGFLYAASTAASAFRLSLGAPDSLVNA